MTIPPTYTPARVPLTFSLVHPKRDQKKVAWSLPVVDVSGYEYELCEAHSHNMWSSSKSGFYGEGILNTETDECLTERTGTLGEMAYGKLFHTAVDLSYRHKGDNKDFISFDISIDMKTAREPYGSGLVMCRNERGIAIRLKCDVYVFGFIVNEDREGKLATIAFVGWCYRDDLNMLPEKPSPKAKAQHRNKEMPYEKMKPMSLMYSSYWEHFGEKHSFGDDVEHESYDLR